MLAWQIPASFEGVVEQMEAARGPLEYGKGQAGSKGVG